MGAVEYCTLYPSHTLCIEQHCENSCSEKFSKTCIECKKHICQENALTDPMCQYAGMCDNCLDMTSKDCIECKVNYCKNNNVDPCNSQPCDDLSCVSCAASITEE